MNWMDKIDRWVTSLGWAVATFAIIYFAAHVLATRFYGG